MTSKKTCTGPCQRAKSLSEYARDSSRKDGRRSRCKDCSNKGTRKPVKRSDDGTAKVCLGCGKMKDLREYHRHPSTPDGHHPRCKSCRSVRVTPLVKRSDEGTAKECRACGKMKDLSEFSTCYNVPDGKDSRCNECRKADARQQRATNPEKNHAAARRYRAANRETIRERKRKKRAANPGKHRAEQDRRRAWKQNADSCVILPKERDRIYASPCHVCGHTGTSENPITKDHRIPLSRGGRDAIGNCDPMCRNCNISKGTKTLMEWKLWLSKINEAA